MTDKFTALVHFLIAECENPARLGAIRLNKALWYSDMVSFRVNGAPITDSKYIKHKMEPVPAKIRAALDNLKAGGKIFIQEPKAPYEQKKFVSLVEPDVSCLSDEDKHVAKHALSVVVGHTASVISESTHDIVWEAAREGEEVPIVATLAANKGEITEKAIKWANQYI